MNLLELRATGEWSFTLTLHPRVNVLVVTDADRRQRLRDLLAGILRGELAGLTGELSIDTAHFELEPEVIEILGIPPGIDVIVRAEDLPGARLLETPAEAHQAPEPSPEQAAVEEQPEPPAAVEAEPEQESEPEPAPAAPPPPPAPAEPDPQVTALEDELRQVEATRRADEVKLAGLAPEVPAGILETVESQLEHLRAAEETGPVPSPEAIALADRWAAARAAWAERAPASDVDLPPDHPVRRELDDARVELTRAEHGARPLYVTPEAADELDRAHAAVADAEERAVRRLANPLAKRRFEAAKAAEAEILKRIGVSSYDAYLMQSSPGMVDADAQQQASAARRRLADAQVAYQEALAALRSPEGTELEAELDGLRNEAARLLDELPADDDLEAALRQLRVVPDVEGLRSELRGLVGRAGGQLGEADGAEDIEAWLKKVRAQEDERIELRRALADLDRQVDDLVRRLEAARMATSQPEPQADIPSDAAAPEPEAQAESQTEAQAEAQTVPEPVAAEPAAPAPAAARVDVSAVGAKDAELYVLARIAAQRAVGDAGPLPLVIDDALANFAPHAAAPVLDLLSRMSGIVQVLYLTADDAIRAWAERLGPEEASVFHFGPAEHGA